MGRWRWMLAVMAAGLMAGGAARAQTGPSLSRGEVREGEPAEKPAKPKAKVEDVLRKMATNIDRVDIQDATVKDAFKWWSDTVGVKLVINWERMEEAGVAADTKVTLDLNEVPAGTVLGLIMQRAQGEQELIYQVTPWYIQIMTKKEANRTNVVKVYEVGDLVHDPAVGPAPVLALEVWTPRSIPGVTVAGPAVIRGVEVRQSWSGPKSNQEMGEKLAQVVRETVEPEVWQEGGGKATIKFFRGTLVVNAPEYVHAQIGYPIKEGERPVVFLNKRVKIEADPKPVVTEAGVTTVKEEESRGIGVKVRINK